MSKKMQCAVTDADREEYAKVDGVWRELGLAAPARRALINHNIWKRSDLRKFTLAEIAEFHGIGKNALAVLKPLVKK